MLVVAAHFKLPYSPVGQDQLNQEYCIFNEHHPLCSSETGSKTNCLSVADDDLEYNKPGAERSRRRRGEDDDLDR